MHYVVFIGITCFYNIIGLGNQHEEFLLSGLAVALLLLPSLHHLPVVLGGPREVAWMSPNGSCAPQLRDLIFTLVVVAIH